MLSLSWHGEVFLSCLLLERGKQEGDWGEKCWVMTESPDVEQVLVCSSISAACPWAVFISCQCVCSAGLLGQSPMESPAQLPAWIPESFSSGASSVWVLFPNSERPWLCSREGFPLMLQHFHLGHPARAVGGTWQCWPRAFLVGVCSN